MALLGSMVDAPCTPKTEDRQRRRARSPGRRLTETFQRSNSGMEGNTMATPTTLRKAASVSGAIPFSLPTVAADHTSAHALPHSHSDSYRYGSHYTASLSGSRIASADDNVFADKLSDGFSAAAPSQILTIANDGMSPPRKKSKRKKNRSDVDQSKSMIRRICSLCYNFISFITATAIIIGLISVLVSVAIFYMANRCKELQSARFDLGYVRTSISKEVFGQEIAVNELMGVLEHFDSVKYGEPHIVWCVGWMGTGKSRTMDLLKQAIANKTQVQYFLPSLIPSSDDALEAVVSSAVLEMNPCLKNVIIIDGWDDGNNDNVIGFVQYLLRSIRLLSDGPGVTNVNQVLIVISGIRGARAINREYLSERINLKERQQLTLNSFSNVLKQTKEFDIIEPLGPLTVIPFLPLEANHVVMCVKNRLKYLKRLVSNNIIKLGSDDALNNISEDDIAEQVVARHTFLPAEGPLMSSTGCKRVLATLRLLLGDPDSIEE